MKKHYESKTRSLYKALTLRIIIIIADIFIVYGLTRRYDVTIAVIVLTNLIGTVIHFFHERIWNQIHWGKKH